MIIIQEIVIMNNRRIADKKIESRSNIDFIDTAHNPENV